MNKIREIALSIGIAGSIAGGAVLANNEIADILQKPEADPERVVKLDDTIIPQTKTIQYDPSQDYTTDKNKPPKITKLDWKPEYELPKNEGDKLTLEDQKGWLLTLDIDAEKAIQNQMIIMQKQIDDMKNEMNGDKNP